MPVPAAASAAPLSAHALGVLVVSRLPLLREALESLLTRRGYRVSVTAPAPADLVVEQAMRMQAQVMLVDATTLGLSGLAQALSSVAPVRAVVIGVGSVDDALALIAAGALACLGEDASLDELERALAAAARGEVVLPPRLAEEVVRRALLVRRWSAQGQPLTRRELEVAALLRLGRSNKEIARELHIEIATVKNHVHSILAKLGLRGRRDVARRTA